MSRYTVHGLVIASGMELPYTVYVGEDDADLHIRRGSVPAFLVGAEIRTSWFEQDSAQCLMRIEHVGRFLIRDGNTIVVEARADVDPSTLALWLSGPAMGALLHQRGILPLHAAALLSEQGAILVGGPSGSGKSTTTAALVNAGYRLISDDLSAICLDEVGVPWVQPGNCQQKLWHDAIQRLGLAERPWERLSAYDGKYAAPLGEACCADKAPVAAIYVLRQGGDKVGVRALSGRAKIEQLGAIIYRPELISSQQARLREMQVLAALAVQARIAEVARPPTGDTLDAVVQALIQDRRM